MISRTISVNVRMRTAFRLGLLASAASILVAAPAGAVTLSDNYWGGINYYNPANGDVIEDPSEHTFEISDMQVTRINNGNTLKVIVDTMFAGAPEAGTSDGTTYGSLFFTSAAAWTSTVLGTAANHYSTDTFHPGLWTSAFVMNGNLSKDTSGSGGLYTIGTTQTPNYYLNSSNNAAVTYTTNNGKIVMSNVNGNPNSYPNSPNPGFYFRQDQAVQYNPTNPSSNSDIGSTWSEDALNHTITYLINDNGSLGDSFAISWAMTCSNDIIQGVVDLGTGGNPPPRTTPLPAALPLFASGLGLFGFAGRRRRQGYSA